MAEKVAYVQILELRQLQSQTKLKIYSIIDYLYNRAARHLSHNIVHSVQ